ncbi:MAG: hypothetical protein HYR72_25975 [Deltaproteobacteria bacterium]|nr:hypothetical protein [Deltaproteobacteria bacterium]MBI3391347.1 hypothetical protein [Deltaproteobacteria bacterium]
MTAVLIGLTVVAASAAPGQQQQIPPGCAQIVAVLEQGGGSLSAEEVAKKTSTDVETVRNCTDQWRATMKDANAPKGGGGAAQPIAAGCAKIVAILDQGGGGLSADEIARRASTDVETVRNCTDQWRSKMRNGANP